MKRNLRKPVEIYYGAAKRTKQEMQPRKENRIENSKVQQPKKLERELKTIKDENEKSKGIIETLEAQLKKSEMERTNARTELELIQEENRKIKLENEKCKGVIESLEAQLKKSEMERTNARTELELIQEENRKMQSKNEKCKEVIESLEAQLKKSEIEIKNAYTELEVQSEVVQCVCEVVQFEVMQSEVVQSEVGQSEVENDLLIHDEEVVEEFCAVNMGTSGAEAIAADDVLKHIPICESIFTVWDLLLKEPSSFEKMMNFYLSINIKDEKAFLKECINKTFTGLFIQKIHFDSNSKFNDSNILLCLIRSFIEKFKDKVYDDIQARSKIVAGFLRFRNAESKRKARKK